MGDGKRKTGRGKKKGKPDVGIPQTPEQALRAMFLCLCEQYQHMGEQLKFIGEQVDAMTLPAEPPADGG